MLITSCKNIFLTACKNFLYSVTAFLSSALSLFITGFRDLFVGIIEAVEFKDYPLVAISVFYKCMFQYKSQGHKCDFSLLF